MKCSWSDIDLGWRFGDVTDQVREAIEIATLLDTRCTFEFQNTIVSVDKNCDLTGTVKAVLAVQGTDEHYVSGIRKGE